VPYRSVVARLEVATAVRPAGAGRYEAVLDGQWRIGTKPNGGYLLAVLARAAVEAAGPEHPHPAAVSAHYLAAPEAGPAVVEVEMLRRGRSAAQLRATLLAGGARCVDALVTCGQLPPTGGPPYWTGVVPPDLPAEEACLPVPADDPRFPVPLFGEVAARLDPASAGFAVGRPAGKGEIRGWVRVAPAPPDPYALLVAVDCLPPATFDLGLAGSWVPTLELTAYLRALPAPGPLRVRQRARLVANGRVDEECDVWDSAGALVATGHQLAAVRLPSGED
jgi:acyl-Coa thioesterase superfamily protein/acyl-CoA thioesterase superfamily protein